MGRPKNDEYWKHVTKEKNGSLKCKHCGHKFKGGASRIKWHVERIEGKGIAICSSFDHRVDGVHKSIASSSRDPQEVANVTNSREVFEGGNEIINTNTGGSMAHQNINESMNLSGGAVTDSMIHRNNIESILPEAGDVHERLDAIYNSFLEEATNGGHETVNATINGSIANTGFEADGDREMMDATINFSMPPQNNNEPIVISEGSESPVDAVTVTESEWGHTFHTFHSVHNDIRHLKQVLRELVCEEDDIKEQLKGLKHRGVKHKRKVDDWLNQVEKLKCEAGHINYTVNQFGRPVEVLSTMKLTERIRKHKKQKPLVLSNEIVGQSFEENVKKMWKLLKDDQVFIIGIHGMGGVGKTCLVTYMENEIKRKGTFNHVFVVNVSHFFSISKLQHDIAERIGAELNGDDVGKRALSLSLALEAKGKSVLILDDVWKNIDLQKVGIPLKGNGIKLIVTSRLEHVCQRMSCSPKSIIKVQPLSHKEGWELFLLKLGHNGTPGTLPNEVVEVARSVAKECDGLPLGISVMARTMRGLNDIHRWRHALNKLGNLEMGEEMEEEVLKVLKLSYDNLMEKKMQDCFLHRALYDVVDRTHFIMQLVDNGLVNGTRTLQEIFDEGRIILAKLEGHSLLVRNYDGIRLHGLVRNMACLMIKKDHRYMVKCKEELTEMPDLQEWTSGLEVVSLMKNKIDEIPEGTSPRCPRLCTLILSQNFFKGIPECFFTHMNALAVLDLSYNEKLRALPNSLSELRSLISLVLRKCSKLEYLPPLGELKALSRLDISHTSIKEVLGLEELINLKWLDLSWCSCSDFIAGSMLSGLTNLQYLDLRGWWKTVVVTEKDLEKMSKLECFAARFEDCQNYNNYVQKIQDKGFGPKAYHLRSGIAPDPVAFNIFPDDMECRTVSFGDSEELTTTLLLPRDLARLDILENINWKCLCHALSCNGPSPLQRIQILGCTELESLFCSLDCCSLCNNLQQLEVCHLQCLESLTAICKEDEDSSIAPSLSSTSMFSRLSDLYILDCHEIKKLFTKGLLRQLQNLEKLCVQFCDSLKEIFAQSNSGGGDDDDEITLPKLTDLRLINLPELKIVSKATIVFGSVPTFRICDCPKLEKFPIIIRQAINSASTDFGSSDSD